MVEEKIVTPDENGEWHYTFNAPKYDEDGNKIQYTVVEVPLYNFIPTYDGYNIKNTYLPPVSLDPPILQKFVVGDPGAPSTRFEFLLRGENGEITFDQAGTFTYTITELNGGLQGWTYDTAVYTLTVTVTEENGKLVPTYTLTKDGQPASELVFTNHYERIVPPDETVISGVKIWNHGNNPNPPDSIIVYVYADGELYAQRKVTGQDGWSYVFEGLPKYGEDGHEIVYTIGEAPMRDYETKVEGYNLVNTYTPGANPGVPENPDGPQTGDTSRLGLWLALMAFSLAWLVCTALFGRVYRKRKDQDARRF